MGSTPLFCGSVCINLPCSSSFRRSSAVSRCLRSWAQSSFPEWFLPTNIVLKRQKDGWDEEFDAERSTYQDLACLQGIVIPTCYGQVQHDGKRALSLFEQALGTLASHGISHGDLKLDNFHLVGKPGNRAMFIVDLENVDIIQPEHDRAWIVQSDVSHLMQAYRDHLVCLEYDGLLFPRERL
ncbi:hypothetical protein QBC37DRAFT_458617 [Rhypophila decipiens]|uniref:Uncharacterized protein n=1 Tax=Rhypophila decipiens TaxID=261697 RepID=A0AAN6XXU4_9PEZI|nr:hypothetical protein QBC37DRAFT_458617 [Rhypophila decipiens]